MKLAIIGAGISGLTAAYYLREKHDITVFEQNGYLGGHTNTVEVEVESGRYAIDTGFIVFNYRTYPNFTRLLDELGIESQPTSMTFSVKCESTGLEYRGADVNGLFAQRKNLLSLRFLRMLRDMVRFNRRSLETLADLDERLTIGEYFQRERYSPEFINKYFLPMGSAVWSCPRGVFEQFPVRFIIEFYRNHGLLSLTDRPQWRVIRGGSHQYVRAMAKHFAERVVTHSPILSVDRSDERVFVRSANETWEFDHVIFACHSDQALKILGDQATENEKSLLGSFPYERNTAVLHTDAAVLPKNRRAWAAWNYFLPTDKDLKATVTYDMKILQGLKSPEEFCVTLNGDDQINPDRILKRFVYHHPVFTVERSSAQRRHRELCCQSRTSFCGAYWGNGFHEDGVNSALAVCQALEPSLCRVVSTKDGSDTVALSPLNTSSAIACS